MASLLQQVRACNQAYRAGTPEKLEEKGDPFVVLTCVDGRLTGFLEPALGLPRHRAVVIRVAGAQISESSTDVLRSVAAAAYLKNAKELFVVAHTDCALARFSAVEVIEAFRRAGVPRAAFGDGDLRAWFGAFPDIRSNVLASIAQLRRSGILPGTFKIHGLVLGTEDAVLDVVFDGDAARGEEPLVAPQRPAATPAETRNELPVPPAPAPPSAPPQTPAAPPKYPVIIADLPQRPDTHRPASPADAAMVLRNFFLRESRDAHFQQSLAEFRKLLKHERNPARIIRALERLAQDYRTRYPDLPGTVEYLGEAAKTEGASAMQFVEFMRRILE